MRRTLFVALAAGAALVLPAAGALAHVTVNPREATQGSYAKLAFRVPNERDNANTTKLEVNLPADHPFTSVSVRPKAGWSYTVDKLNITWSGGVIKPGEFDEFEISVGPLPSDADSLTFKAVQTYSNGEVVRWIEEPTAAGAQPDKPAPVLKLTKAADTSATTATTAPAPESQAGEVSQPASKDTASKKDVDTARTFGLIGMAFGLLGFVSAMAARRRRTDAS